MSKLRSVLCLIVLALSVFIAVPKSAMAQGSGLSITPVISEYTIKPGQSQTLTLTIKDIIAGSVIAQPTIADFEADGVSGTPKIITDPNVTSPNTIRRFVGGLTDTRLDSGQQTNLTVTLKAPSDIKPGVYYGVLRFKALPVTPGAANPNEVSLSASVGSIVLITVPGNLNEQAQLKNIHVYKGNNEGKFFFGVPTDIGLEIKNLGDTYVKPFGTVQVKNMSGKVVDSYQISDQKQLPNILPQSTRLFKNGIKNVSSPGRYTITASIAYGSGANILTAQKTFWYIPKWVAYVFLALLAIILFLVYYLRRHRHGHRRGHR